MLILPCFLCKWLNFLKGWLTKRIQSRHSGKRYFILSLAVLAYPQTTNNCYPTISWSQQMSLRINLDILSITETSTSTFFAIKKAKMAKMASVLHDSLITASQMFVFKLYWMTVRGGIDNGFNWADFQLKWNEEIKNNFWLNSWSLSQWIDESFGIQKEKE